MSQALTFSIPSPSASLDRYIQAVNRFPMLSQEEEADLARRFRQDNDLETAWRLVLSHLRVVVALSRGYRGYGLPQADLIQEGNVGLMKAVKRFDPDRGVRLVSFAIHWIKAEIHEFILRNWKIVKLATTKAQRKLFFNLRSLRQGANALRPQEIRQMARQLGVKPEEVAEMEIRMGGHDVPLEAGPDEEDHLSPIDYLADPEAEPTRLLEQRQTERLRQQGLTKALDALDERSRRIIEARWLREQDSATLHELAAEFQVSGERIRQIEQRALQKMKALMAG